MNATMAAAVAIMGGEDQDAGSWPTCDPSDGGWTRFWVEQLVSRVEDASATPTTPSALVFTGDVRLCPWDPWEGASDACDMTIIATTAPLSASSPTPTPTPTPVPDAQAEDSFCAAPSTPSSHGSDGAMRFDLSPPSAWVVPSGPTTATATATSPTNLAKCVVVSAPPTKLWTLSSRASRPELHSLHSLHVVPHKKKSAAVTTVARYCTCPRSHCLKKYCECHARGLRCMPSCGCVGCLNHKADRDDEVGYERSVRRAHARSSAEGCACKGGCGTGHCICRRNGVKCGALCRCEACVNSGA